MLGVEIWQAVMVISLVSGIYITAGGQTAVIFTDLMQGFMLLFAGLLLFVLGLDYLALDGAITEGIKALWANLTLSERLPFAHFNKPQSFNFVGVFWQDGIAGSITFLFISQGLIMRFPGGQERQRGSQGDSVQHAVHSAAQHDRGRQRGLGRERHGGHGPAPETG